MKKLVLAVVVMALAGKSFGALVFDLNGDGVKLTPRAKGTWTQILFDHNADGVRTGTAWVDADDGLLVLDRDDNGTIDSGRELFGNDTLLANDQKASDGHTALAMLDSDNDGQITSQDAAYSRLRIWRDHNQDGIFNPDELQSLADAHITRIGLTKTAGTQVLADGTKFDGTGSFTINGQERTYIDVCFAGNGFYRKFTDIIPLTDEAGALPPLRGSGMVRDLREAASLDGQLAKDYAALSGLPHAGIMTRLDDFIARWAETSTMPTSFQQAKSYGYTLVYLPAGMTEAAYLAASGNDAKSLEQTKEKQQRIYRLINILERFNAQTWVDVGVEGVRSGGGINYGIRKLPGNDPYVFVPFHPEQQKLFEKSYDQLKNSIYRGLSHDRRGKNYSIWQSVIFRALFV
jgi:hypothetical protein